MEDKKKFWIVSEVFYPDETSSGYYLTEIAKKIAQYQDVNVICGPLSYEKKSNLVSTQPLPLGINVFRIKVFTLDKNKIISRVIRLINLTLSFTFKLSVKVKKKDHVLLVTNPAFLVPIATLLSKIIGFHLTLLVHDVFPENLAPIKLLNPIKIPYKILKFIFDKSYASAHQIIVCGRDMDFLFKQKTNFKQEITLIENWSDIDVVYPSLTNQQNIYQDLGLKGKIVFQYAGNIGRLQGLEELIILASSCINPNIHFIFIGEGALKASLQEEVKFKKLTNISFLPSFNRNQQNIFLNACDVGIVSLNDNMLGLGVPSKSYNIIAAGKPILFLGNKNSEISLMVNENNIGWQFELAQKKDIINFFNNFSSNQIGVMGVNARVIAETKYSKKKILEKYVTLINSRIQ